MASKQKKSNADLLRKYLREHDPSYNRKKDLLKQALSLLEGWEESRDFLRNTQSTLESQVATLNERLLSIEKAEAVAKAADKVPKGKALKMRCMIEEVPLSERSGHEMIDAMSKAFKSTINKFHAIRTIDAIVMCTQVTDASGKTHIMPLFNKEAKIGDVMNAVLSMEKYVRGLPLATRDLIHTDTEEQSESKTWSVERNDKTGDIEATYKGLGYQEETISKP